MNRVLMVAVLFVVTRSFAQCPFSANLTAVGECPGASLTVSSTKNIAKIVWTRDGTALGTALATSSYNPMGVTVAGGNGAGAAANQLDHPQGIYVDPVGNVIVADENNNRIQAWAVGSSFGNTLASSYGVGSDPLVFPMDVTFDGYNNLYITDYTKERIEKWAELASTGVIVAGGNGLGAANNQLNAPVGIFLDLNGNLYIADGNNQRIEEYASGASYGVTVAGGNGAGSGANQFQFCSDVFVDGSGNMYVVDDLGHRVQKWAPGASVGVTVAGGNGPGAAANQLDYPYGVYVDGSGNVFVADAGNNRVQEWAPGASVGVTVAGGNGPGPAANQLNDPRFVRMDANGNLYVSDDLNARVQKFTLQTTINGTFTAPSPGVYTADVTFFSGCTAPSNSITILGPGTPSVTITASANPVNLCTNVTFTASYAGAGSNPLLQWQVNGVNAGTGGSTFSTGSLHNGDIVTCVLMSNDACVSTTPVTSNAVSIGVNALPEATMIGLPATATGKTVFCPGDTLAITSVDSLSQIVWSNNGAAVSTAEAIPVGSAITVAGGNGPGSAANQLDFPADAVLDAQGNIYIADDDNNRIMKWAPGAGSGTPVTIVQLEFPTAVAVDATGNVYTSVNLAASVLEFPVGSSLDAVAAGGHGIGSEADQLDAPGAIFLDAAGNLYVSDAWNYRVQKWAPGASSGVTVAGGHGIGPDNDQVEPGVIFVDGAGNLFVFDAGYNRLMEWAPGATSGVQVLGPADINYAPSGIWVDGAGNIYLSDGVDNSVKKYAPGSKIGVTVAGGNGEGSAANQLDGPASLFLDAKGDIYVTDSRNHRVQEFLQHPTIDSIYRAATPGTYTAAVTTSGGCVLGTNTMVVKPWLSPGVSVTSAATEVCANSLVTLTAVPVNGGTAPVYSWLVNGVPDAAEHTPVFASTLTAGVANIVVQMTTNADCPLQPSAASSPVAITVDAVVTPAVVISTPATTICSGAAAEFVATPTNGGSSPTFQWTVNGNPAGGDSPDLSVSGLANGDVVVCELTSDAACVSAASAFSNTISMQVKTVVAPTIDVTASPNPVCSGLPVTFSTEITNGGATPAYSWLLNGSAAGSGPAFTTSQLADGDVVSCKLSTGDVCAAAVSNSVVMQVYPTPVIDAGQVFTSTGTGVVLDAPVSGDIVQYTWAPATGLSATDIANPVADPARSLVYTLTVVSDKGCTASGEVTVKVYSDIRLPNAFTPNGDGRNDKFYVLGGPQGSMIKDFAVFDRWGTAVFQVHDVAPGDAAYGWDGTYKGGPATAGTYAYVLVVTLAGGKQQVFKGVVMLLR